VEVGVLLEVVRLEVVGPQHRQVVLDQLGALLLDEDAAVRKTSSSESWYFFAISCTDSASMRAWAGL
jgi:hypothetical protein